MQSLFSLPYQRRAAFQVDAPQETFPRLVQQEVVVRNASGPLTVGVGFMITTFTGCVREPRKRGD
jgi:hypothetical protein